LLDRHGLGRARRLAAGLAVTVGVLAAGCADDRDDVAALHEAADEVLAAVGVTVTRPATEQSSKDIRYITADGSHPGDLASVVDHVVATLGDHRWDVTTSEPIEAADVDAGAAHRVIAKRDGLVVQVLVAGRLGTVTAPDGTQLVQLAVAHPDDRLAWTR
jgi:hypothetical protein